MGITYEDILGERQKFFVASETTAGTFRRPAATDAMAVLTSDFGPSIARKDRRDSFQPSRGTQERITGKSEYSWSTDGYYVPSGSKATAPNCGPLLEALFSNEDINTNDVTYTQNPAGAITAYSDSTPYVTVTTAHDLVNGESVTISGSTNYNGTFIVSSVVAGVSFDIEDTWVADDGASVWVLASPRQSLKTLTLVRQFQGKMMEAMWGCIPESLTLKCSGGDEPKLHVEGRGMGFVQTSNGTLDAAMAADNDLQVQTTEDNLLGKNSVVIIEDDDGSNDLGYRVDSGPVSHVFQIVEADDDGAVTITHADDSVYRPHVPTWTDAGVPTTGITGSLTWDSLAMTAIVSNFELTIKANNAYHDSAAFQQDMSDATPGFFDITGKIDIRLRADAVIKILNRKDFASVALAVVIGGAAESGTRLELDLAQVEMDFSPLSVPESGVATYSLTFTGLESASLNDAITWKHT